MQEKVYADIREVVIVKYNEIKELNKDKKKKPEEDDDEHQEGDEDAKDKANEGPKEFTLDENYDVLKQLATDEDEGFDPTLEIFMVKLVGLQDEWRKMMASKKSVAV